MQETDAITTFHNIAYYDHDLSRPAISSMLHAFELLSAVLPTSFGEINDTSDCKSRNGILSLEDRLYELALIHGPVEPWLKCIKDNGKTNFLFVSSMVTTSSAERFNKLKTMHSINNTYQLDSSYTNTLNLKAVIARLLNLSPPLCEEVVAPSIQSILPHITISSFSASEFAYKEQFEELWCGIADRAQQIVENDRHQEYIIHFNGIPHRAIDSPVALENYLTPADYAVVLSLAIQAIAQILSKPVPSFCIHIIDEVSSTLSAPSWNFLRHTSVSGRCSLIPWVRIYSASPADSASWADLNELAEHLSCSDFCESIPCMKLHSHRESLQMVKSIWQAFILNNSADNSRHALANIMGPLLLLDATEVKQDPQLHAMRILLQELDLISNADSDLTPYISATRSWLDSELVSTFNYISQGAQIPVLLIDDQFAGEQAWGKIIAYALGATTLTPLTDTIDGDCCKIAESHLFTLHASSSPESILRWIEKRDKLDKLRFNMDFGLSGLGIIFLDLRLYSGRSLREELSVLSRILRQCQRFMEHSSNPPWKGFSEEELTNIQFWIDSTPTGRDSSSYLHALTLFPRLLSLLDPTLPIILFTSTGRRSIITTLEPYGNIFCGLEKPRIGISEIDNPADHCKRQFVAALKQAGALLPLRRKLQNLTLIECRGNLPEPKPPLKHAHASLYIDESGDGENNRMVVAGILAVSADKSTLTKFNRSLLASDKLHWGKGGTLKKRADNGEQEALFASSAAAILDQAVLFNIDLYAVCAIQASKDERIFADNALVDDSFLDNRYRRLLALLVETVMFQSVPLLLDGKIDILPEVRSKKITSRNKLNERFGILPVNQDTYHILQPQEVIGIVSQLISGYARQGIYSSVEANVVRGCIIPDGNDADTCEHQLHHLVDWLAHYVYKFINHKTPLPDWINCLLDKAGSNTIVDSATARSLFACHRELSAGETLTALEKYLETGSKDFKHPHALEAKLFASASEAIASLPGHIYLACSNKTLHDITADQVVLETTVVELQDKVVVVKDLQSGKIYTPLKSFWGKIHEPLPACNDTVFCGISYTMDGQKRVSPIARKA